MGESIALTAESRDKKNSIKSIRKEGYIPGVIYGSGTEPRSIKVLKKEFDRVYEKAGESTLIDLKINSDISVKSLIYDIQKDAVKNRVLHVDFFKVNMKEKITTEIPLIFEGVSKAVDEMQGVLVKNMDSIEVECLPNDLVSELKVDISKLETFDDSITLADIKFPAGVEPTLGLDVMIASVLPPAQEEAITEPQEIAPESAPTETAKEQ